MWNKRKFRFIDKCSFTCTEGIWEDDEWWTVLETGRPKHEPSRYAKALKKVLDEIKYKDCPFN